MKMTSSAAFILLLSIALPLSAQAQDASGTWDVTFTTQNGPTTVAMTLKKDGDKLAGTVSGPQGDVAVEGTQKDQAVALNLSVQTPNGPLAIAMTGTQTGDAIAGTLNFGQGTLDWTGKRRGTVAAATVAKTQEKTQEKPADISGVWAFQIEIPGGGTGTPTVTFKQDGEKLSGTYSSQVLGERQFTGSIKGNAFTFSFDAEVQGTSFKVTYNGTVDKDTMKGTVALGDLGEGSFTGKKK
jgi:hypothetical protein